jgi:hypothetical protein
MTKRLGRLIEIESKVKVATPAYRPTLENGAVFFASAFVFAGAFYFFGGFWWRALAGG